MKFDLIDAGAENERYALLYPTVEQNGELKGIARELGNPDMLKFKKPEGKPEWRLYESRIPAGVDVEASFGRFATDKAKEAFEAEVSTHRASRETTSRASQAPAIPEEKLYYPAMKNGDRAEFDQLRKQSGANFYYNSKAGAFVHKDGPTAGFEKFQTAEAKSAWKAEYDENKSEKRNETARAGNVIDVVAERASGNHFVADNAMGFKLPSTKHEQLRADQVAALKAAPNEQVVRVHARTKEQLEVLERKQYAIQLSAAQKADPSLEVKAFNAMKPEERSAAAKRAGLNNDDFAQMVSLRAGFFALRNEMIERGLIKSKEQAQEASKSKGSAKGGEEKSQGLKPAAEEPKKAAEEPKKARGRGAQMAAALGNGIGG